jgi:hypothetical protein
MAKKPAPKKKASAAKPAKKIQKKVASKPAAKVTAKSSKPAAKVTKAVKPALKAPPALAKAQKAEKPKPALMTKKGQAAVAEEVEETKATPSKTQTVVSMLESDSHPEDAAKAEKVSKVKPVKIERGNTADEKAKWAELNKKYGKDKAVSYKMSEKFETMIPLQHKVLGWGFILTNENDRLEVLFETGIRMLISNYKST